MFLTEPLLMQRSPLRISPADDPLEKQAEKVADRVMRMRSPEVGLIQRCPGGCPDEEMLRRQVDEEENDGVLAQRPSEGLVQRSHKSPVTAVRPEVASSVQARRGGGNPLPLSTRRFFEPRFGSGLSGVRVHYDEAARRLAASLNARAFTFGRDVFFGKGEWAPGTSGGDRLIAHELGHALRHDPRAIRRAGPRWEAPGGRTDYRFDTYRITRQDLLREEILVRLNELELEHLKLYRDRVADPAVASFIADIIQARRDEENAVGRRIVSNYMSLTKKLQCPGGACFTVARGRVEQASREIMGQSLTEHLTPEQETTFDRIWGSLIRPRDTWLEIAGHVRGKGAPGAMVFAGKGEFVTEDEIWAGGLQPGAVIQTWALDTDAEKVRNGEVPGSYGHSFIFLRYKRAGGRHDGAIEGIEIADQGFQSGGALTRSDYEWWIGANITIRSERRFIRPWSLVQETETLR